MRLFSLALLLLTVSSQAQSLPAEPHWVKQHAVVRLIVLCDSEVPGKLKACSAGTATIIDPRTLLTAHHVIEQYRRNPIRKLRVCRPLESGGCLADLDVTQVLAARFTDTTTQALHAYDVALLKFPADLLSAQELAQWSGQLALHPLKLGSVRDSSTVWAIGAGYLATGPYAGPPLIEDSGLRLATAQYKVPASALSPELWNDATAKHEVLRTCEALYQVSPGFSGGPVLTDQGELVGIITGRLGEKFYSAPVHKSYFVLPVGDPLNCGYSVVISPLPLAWPSNPFSSTDIPGVEYAPYATVTANSSKLNLASASAFSADEEATINNFEGVVAVNLGSSSERVARYLGDVLTREETARERTEARLGCYLDRVDALCDVVERLEARQMVPPSTPVRPPKLDRETDSPDSFVALAVVESLRKIWGAQRSIEVITRSAMQLDGALSVGTGEAGLSNEERAQVLSIARSRFPPKPRSSSAIDCSGSADDVATSPFEDMMREELNMSLDDRFDTLSDKMVQLRALYFKYEGQNAPTARVLQHLFAQALAVANAIVAVNPKAFGWPSEAAPDIGALKFKCFAPSAQLQRLTWTVMSATGMVPKKMLGIASVERLLQQDTELDQSVFLELVRDNGPLALLAAKADGKQAAASTHLTQLRALAIELNQDSLITAMGVGALNLNRLLTSTYLQGTGAANWERNAARVRQFECHAQQLVRLVVGLDEHACTVAASADAPSSSQGTSRDGPSEE
jgi:hypothetical protein